MSKKHDDDVFRHNFHKDCKLHKVCVGHDDVRPVMECVHFENGYAFASDSHKAVRLAIEGISNLEPEEIEKLNGKTLHGRYFKELLDCDVITEITEEGIKAQNVGQSSADGKQVFFKFNNDLKYPKIQDLFVSTLLESKKGASKLGIKPRLLVEVGEAMNAGSLGVVMEITDERRAIVVYPASMVLRPYAVAIVMPMMVTDDE